MKSKKSKGGLKEKIENMHAGSAPIGTCITILGGEEKDLKLNPLQHDSEEEPLEDDLEHPQGTNGTAKEKHTTPTIITVIGEIKEKGEQKAQTGQAQNPTPPTPEVIQISIIKKTHTKHKIGVL